MEEEQPRPAIDDKWRSEYGELARTFLARYFGSPPNLALLFHTLRPGYPWAAHRPRVLDSRVHAKNNEEYHGLERHAWQYHVTAQYAEAYHFFLMGAALRREDANLMQAGDASHSEAVRFCIRHALFNKALDKRPSAAGTPSLEEFGIDATQYDKRVQRALDELEASVPQQY
jgi:hypothetical protein